MSKPVYRFCFGVAACVLSGVSLDVMPAQAAAFSFSSSRLTFDTPSALPKAKSSVLGTDAIAQTKEDIADNFFDGTLNFVADDTVDNTTRLDGLFETRSIGDGAGYFGQSQITSNVFAEFFVTPEQPFSLNFQFSSFLQNAVDSVFERATARSMVSLSLLDPNQTVLSFFTLDASVNTSPRDQQNNETLLVNTNAQLLSNNTQLLPGANQETGNVGFSGNFFQSVAQPTLLTLQVNTLNQSCVQAPNDNNTCVKVPEPAGMLSFAVATALGLLFIPKLPTSAEA